MPVVDVARYYGIYVTSRHVTPRIPFAFGGRLHWRSLSLPGVAVVALLTGERRKWLEFFLSVHLGVWLVTIFGYVVGAGNQVKVTVVSSVVTSST